MEITLPTVDVTAVLLITLGQVLLSLAASYIPGFREWYAARTPVEKSLGMLIAVTAISLIIGILSFTGIWVLISPTKEGVIFLVLQYLIALQGNQTAYSLSPQVKSVIEIKARRNI